MKDTSKNPLPHFVGSGIAALVNFPLWKASALAQSGIKLEGHYGAAYMAALSPPYKGAVAVVGGMTWARAAIFYGSEVGRPWLQELRGEDQPSFVSTAVPPLVVSTLVQIVNQPLVRSSIQVQDPASRHPTVFEAMRAIARERGIFALWHGTTAGILKTVPKYCVAVVIKETLEDRLPRYNDGGLTLARSAVKAVTAATAGALLTNPLDVLRNSQFQTHLSLPATVLKLSRESGFSWLARGADKNIIAVAVPVAMTIFVTDQLNRFF